MEVMATRVMEVMAIRVMEVMATRAMEGMAIRAIEGMVTRVMEGMAIRAMTQETPSLRPMQTLALSILHSAARLSPPLTQTQGKLFSFISPFLFNIRCRV